MRNRHPLLTLASAAVLAVTLSHDVLASEGEAHPATTAPTAGPAVPTETPTASAETVTAPAPTTPIETTEAAVSTTTDPTTPTEAAAIAPAEAAEPPTPMEVARQRAEQRRADAMEQRGLRYEELRDRAAQAGVALPETPPWEQVTPPEMPEMPEMPAYPATPEIPDRGMMRAKERAAHITKMRGMSLEERMAEREARWAEMRERAAQRGIELPETPPWKAAMERRKAMQEKWEAYRKTIEEMTDEQREAAQAMFGQQAPTAGPAAFGRPPFPGIVPEGAAPGGFGPPAMSTGSYGPCGRMPCQGGYPGRNMGPQMGPRPPMMYPQGGPGGNQGPYRQ